MTKAALVAVAASAALATSAEAGVVTRSATDCGDPELSQPFTRWLDSSYYKLVDDFETGAGGWTLTGGARVVDGNAPQREGARSLLLPAGSTATTPPVCVGLDEPTLRYFSRQGSGLVAPLTVTVQVQLSLGAWVTLPVGTDAGGAWGPSPVHPVVANLLTLSRSDKTAIRFKFAPAGGSWQIDDVFVDPRNRA